MHYVSLHTHTTFSFGDGYGTVQQHVKRVADLGMAAVALTEHGNVSSHAQLEKHAKAVGIKPIYGIEAYISQPEDVRKTHLIILAADDIGYANLNRIVSYSWADKHKSKFPTVYWPRLRDHSEGLIVLSGCSDSELNCTLMGGKNYGDKRDNIDLDSMTAGMAVATRYKEVFGDRYYLETQRFYQLARTRVLNAGLAHIGRKLGIPLAATSDVHYPMPEDNKMQTILHAAHRNSSVEATEAGWEYDILLTYPQSDDEVLADLENAGLSTPQARQAFMNTAVIAERCNVTLPKSERIRYKVSAGDWGQW